MAVISGLSYVLSVLKKTDITGDNSLGRSRSGYGTKIHMAIDASGIPLNIMLIFGQAYKCQFALRHLEGIGVQRGKGQHETLYTSGVG
ncbi:MAG: hypothetical protein G5700_01915 [Serratia symbiotica]|nr:hypothetical protein [Serratia symbiotica]